MTAKPGFVGARHSRATRGAVVGISQGRASSAAFIAYDRRAGARPGGVASDPLATTLDGGEWRRHG